MTQKWTYRRLVLLLSISILETDVDEEFLDDESLRLDSDHPLNMPSGDLPPYSEHNPKEDRVELVPELKEWRQARKSSFQRYAVSKIEQGNSEALRDEWKEQLSHIDRLIKYTHKVCKIREDWIGELRVALQKYPALQKCSALIEPYDGFKRISLSEVLESLKEARQELQSKTKGVLPRSLQDQMVDMPADKQEKIRDLFPRGGAEASEDMFSDDPLALNTLNSLKTEIEELKKTKALFEDLVRCKAWLEFQLDVLSDEERYFKKHGEVRSILKDESDSQKAKRELYTGPVKNLWRYASNLYKNNERWRWRDIYDFMVEEQKKLGLSNLRHSSFKSFSSARTTYQSKHPEDFWD